MRIKGYDRSHIVELSDRARRPSCFTPTTRVNSPREGARRNGDDLAAGGTRCAGYRRGRLKAIPRKCISHSGAGGSSILGVTAGRPPTAKLWVLISSSPLIVRGIFQSPGSYLYRPVRIMRPALVIRTRATSPCGPAHRRRGRVRSYCWPACCCGRECSCQMLRSLDN
jgi:hypothetical protein